ncbi:MAG: dTDP-4-dehydrorhamnose 3,5-epimerase [Microscillaceae bacterium]|nr:dTDP-4-dehydrorhamnose 3,5-epimerase [Microscillaceae bacterium]
MPFIQGNLAGLWIFEPRVFEDERGYFFESYNHKVFVEATGFEGFFVQDNHSLSKFGVMRGIHFQKPPHAQSKLVRVLRGTVLDVAVDLRQGSLTFGKYQAIELSAENKKQFFIPVGFGHAFVVLSQEAEVLYKCDNYYAPGYEGGIIYDDPDVGIEWSINPKEMIVSGKDQGLGMLSESTGIF